MDYLRQLRNDEKRAKFSNVATLVNESAASLSNLPLFVIPKRSCVTRVYAITKEPFIAGATVSISIAAGGEAGTIYFTDLPLDTTNVVTMGPGDTQGRYGSDNDVVANFNQAAIDSTVGEAQIIVEYTEVSVNTGAYTR